MNKLRNNLGGLIIIIIVLLITSITSGCGTLNQNNSYLKEEVASQLGIFAKAYQSGSSQTLLTSTAADYFDSEAADGMRVNATRDYLIWEAASILKRFPITKLDITLLNIQINNHTSEVSFSCHVEGYDKAFPAFSYAGVALGNAVFVNVENRWLLRRCRLTKGRFVLIVSGHGFGGSDDPPKETISIVQFMDPVVIGGKYEHKGGSQWYDSYSSIPYPVTSPGFDSITSAEATGFGTPVESGSLAMGGHGLPGYTWIFKRPAPGSYTIKINVQNQVDYKKTIEFNKLVVTKSPTDIPSLTIQREIK